LEKEINFDAASEIIQSFRIQEYVKKKVGNMLKFGGGWKAEEKMLGIPKLEILITEEIRNEKIVDIIKLYFKNIIVYLQKTPNKNSLVKLIDQIKIEYKVCIRIN
jgi:hypothetical protein